ncbi:hypothetical protein ACFWR9_02240 [Streptomyces sp. NPDC058534]|uniref:hypothetical protein n=1 Tax=Streptomyces sp. NPDC058534 TaxID=3346541 RepID=UPI00364EA912
MVVFLLLLLAAVVLGFIGALVKGLLYLLIIGIVLAIAAFLYLGLRMGRGSRRTPR